MAKIVIDISAPTPEVERLLVINLLSRFEDEIEVEMQQPFVPEGTTIEGPYEPQPKDEPIVYVNVSGGMAEAGFVQGEGRIIQIDWDGAEGGDSIEEAVSQLKAVTPKDDEARTWVSAVLADADRLVNDDFYREARRVRIATFGDDGPGGLG